ncbi:MAG: extracellular solute-binding protein [Candidatus Tantalella remota]|nr:extracellular solute-binding protein [Candidatus Tantalella remota]
MEVLRKVFSVLLIAVFALSAAGCGAEKTQKNEIVMWLVGSEGQAHIITELGRDFTAETGVKVICQAISWGDAHSKYLTSIAGDVTPDIGTMGLTWGMEFGELGAMVDLGNEYPEDMALLEQKIFPSLLASTRFGNKVFGIPFDISEHIMYYRTDIIPSPPATWDELLETLRSLKEQDKSMVLDWDSLEWIAYSPFLWQAGGEYYNEDYTKATLDSPEAVAALEFFNQLYEEGVPKTKVPLEQGMRTGDYPIAISGNWKIIRLLLGAPEISGKWSIAMLPAGPSGKRTAFIGGRVLGIFSSSNMKKESWEFIKFLFKPENQIKLYQGSLDTEDSYLPPNMDTWKELPMDRKFRDVLEQQARDAKGPPPVLAWDSSIRFVNHAIQMVVLKNASPAEALAEATKEMQRELDRSRR